MECRAFIELMQEADVAELRDTGDSALAEHVRTCEACAQRAATLVRATDLLAESLSSAEPVDARFVMRRIQVAERPKRVARLASASVAAAALLVFALGVQRLRTNEPAPVSPTAALLENASPDVEVPTGRNAVVFRTSNPKITVVWYYPSEGGP